MAFQGRLRALTRFALLTTTADRKMFTRERVFDNIMKWHSCLSDSDDAFQRRLYEMTGIICNISKMPITNLLVHFAS
jgi:hypothetical protein